MGFCSADAPAAQTSRQRNAAPAQGDHITYRNANSSDVPIARPPRQQQRPAARPGQPGNQARRPAARPGVPGNQARRPAAPRTGAGPAKRPAARPGAAQGKKNTARPAANDPRRTRTGSAGPAEAKKGTKKKKGGRSVGYKIACTVLVFLIVLTVLVTGAGIYLFKFADYQKIDLFRRNDDPQTPQETMYVEDGTEVRTIVPIHEGSVTGGLYDAIRDWKEQGYSNYYLKSTKVINILLAGFDRNPDGSDGRSDTMLIASINLATKEIILSSVYRDCWAYETFDNDTREIWAKMNACLVHGGPSGLVSNLEDYFKIHIDHFVGVDFQSFKDIIDGIGGIEVPVKDYEARYINQQTCYTANPAVAGDSVHLDGFQALWYVRMRHTDSDGEISRTRRQRQFVTALIDKFKGTSITEMTTLVSTFMSYIQTDMSKTEILTYGTRAIMGQWYNFGIRQQQVPDEGFRADAHGKGFFGGQWVWVVDYPGAAHAMQQGIYGYSNVVLNENRRTAVDIWYGR